MAQDTDSLKLAWSNFDAADAIHAAVVVDLEIASYAQNEAVRLHASANAEITRLRALYESNMRDLDAAVHMEEKATVGRTILQTSMALNAARKVRSVTATGYLDAMIARAAARRVVEAASRHRRSALRTAQLRDAVSKGVSDHEANVNRRRKIRLDEQAKKDAAAIRQIALKRGVAQYGGIKCKSHPDLLGQRWAESDTCTGCAPIIPVSA